MPNTYTPEFTLLQEAFTNVAILSEIGIIAIIASFLTCALITRDTTKWKILYFPVIFSYSLLGLELGIFGKAIASLAAIFFIMEIISIQVVRNIARGIGEASKLTKDRLASGVELTKRQKFGTALSGLSTIGRDRLERGRKTFEKSREGVFLKTKREKIAERKIKLDKKKFMTPEERERDEIARLTEQLKLGKEGITPSSHPELFRLKSDRARLAKHYSSKGDLLNLYKSAGIPFNAKNMEVGRQERAYKRATGVNPPRRIIREQMKNILNMDWLTAEEKQKEINRLSKL